MPTLNEFPAYQRMPGTILAAQASWLHGANGSSILDFYGGHCVNSLGTASAQLAQALAEQWQSLSFATNLLQHPGRQVFLDAWQALMPPGSWQVFASNSGAEANENLLKWALQSTGRPTIVCYQGAFHGRTAAAAAVSDGPTGFPLAPFDVRRLPWGSTAGIDSQVAAVILEPIQSLAGVIEAPEGFLQSLREKCTESGCWLLFDEVQTGNGRLGQVWASQHYQVTPDGFSTAKGVAGGLPLGLSFVTENLAAELPSGLSGSTFGGSPMSLAASTVVARHLADSEFLQRIPALHQAFASLVGVGPIVGIRGKGLLVGLELHPEFSATQIQQQLQRLGILVGTCRDPQILRLCPALNLPGSAISVLADALGRLTVAVAN
jgi:acetylornithine/succinyldiaminopimelate/putrescine aminotransferase